MSTAIAGPYCAQTLADLGADVIKVEHPARVFSERTSLSPPGWDGPPFAPYWLATNRNKRSLTLDLKREGGKDVLADLLRVSDVVVENFGSAARSRLVDESWAWEVNPRVIWASLSFCGRTGPDSGLDGFDLLAQGRSGLLSITGFPENLPVKTGNSTTDYLAGAHLAIGVLGALVQRGITGKGQLVDVSLLDSAVACLDGFPMWYSVAGVVPRRMGNNHLSGKYGYLLLECSDGYVVLTVGGTRLPHLVEHVLKMPELLPVPEPGDPDYRSHVAKIHEATVAWMADRSVDEACRVLNQTRVPNAPVRDLAQIWDDEQLEARGMFVEYQHAELGALKAIGSPLHLSDSPIEVRRDPPGAGEHNEQVLTELLGYDGDRLVELIENGVLWG